jgi:trehalose 6-phosphate phosphatase
MMVRMQNNDLKEIGASGIDDVLLHDALPPPPPPADDWALFLDVDGCLLDLASTPDAVVVPDGLRERLEALQSRLDGALALVSGRTIATLDALFAPSRFNAVGLHGVEQRHAGIESVAGEAPPELAGVRKAAARLAAVYDGTVVEDKGPALALHWRRAPDAEPALLAFAVHSLEQLPGYRLQHGKQVVELYPGSADDGERIDKGGAIAELLDTLPFQGRLPVFAGDDLTDESGFEVVNVHGGLSVLVGDRAPSAARHRLHDPAAVRAWLGVEHGAK